GGGGVWSVQARIAGAIIAPGMVQVESNRQVVQHPQGGVVGEILARDGDTVEGGEVLLRLDTSLLKSELAIVETQLYEVMARKARLEAERDGRSALSVTDSLSRVAAQSREVRDLVDGQARLLAARAVSRSKETEQLDEQVLQTRSQIAGTQAQLAATRTQGVLIGKELEDSQLLLKQGLIQAARVSALLREQARLRGQVGNLEATVAQLNGQIAAFGIQKLKLATTRREEAIAALRDLQYREMELSERRLSMRETLARMEVRAPVRGVVHGSRVFARRAVISPAEPILYIVPQDRPLVVVARISAMNIDQVHVGQRVFLRFTAFDRRQTPEIRGHVVRLSADVFTDEATGQSYYQAELLPEDGEMAGLGGRTILPGMPVEVFFRTADRTPLSYLAKPFMDYFNRAFREP
ncbi:HlyD family type I secretion periplasmic adaptor subunit, partial [Rhodovulum imhoffii]|uniref:HlyD family type I secretion periplasmic adaptor subunit n=1 Tax=Rhodovulum imhoffii TaxID=365340 RepID=UPI001914C735